MPPQFQWASRVIINRSTDLADGTDGSRLRVTPPFRARLVSGLAGATPRSASGGWGGGCSARAMSCCPGGMFHDLTPIVVAESKLATTDATLAALAPRLPVLRISGSWVSGPLAHWCRRVASGSCSAWPP